MFFCFCRLVQELGPLKRISDLPSATRSRFCFSVWITSSKMPTQNQSTDDGGCKVRKRGCSSSSSSLSAARNYSLKRAVSIGKRFRSRTPFPKWKVEGYPLASTEDACAFSPKEAPVSARKLANALWELIEMNSPEEIEDLQWRRCRSESRRSNIGEIIIPEMIDQSGFSGSRRRGLLPQSSQKSRFSDRTFTSVSISNGSLAEIELRPQELGLSPTSTTGKSKSCCLKKLSHNLKASTELVKLLGHILGKEEDDLTCISIVSALRVEIGRARSHVNHITEDGRKEMIRFDNLKKSMEHRYACRRSEKEELKLAFQNMAEELELEKRSKKRRESAIKKLLMELAEAKKEIEKERRSRQLVEQVCDDLVKVIGEDKVEVEEMREETAKIREELEKEREMLQLADIWREERVHMKLSEAKFQLEEKNAAVDRLRHELETYLASKRSQVNLTGNGNLTDILGCGEDSAKDDGEVDSVGSDDSAESDLCPIELNMDRTNRNYQWNFTDEEKSAEFTSISVPTDVELFKSRTGDFVHENDEIWERENRKLVDPDAERYNLVKKLRDQMLSSSSSSSAAAVTKKELGSPKFPWIHPHVFYCSDEQEQSHVGTKVSEMLQAMGRDGSDAKDSEDESGIQRFIQQPLQVYCMEK